MMPKLTRRGRGWPVLAVAGGALAGVLISQQVAAGAGNATTDYSRNQAGETYGSAWHSQSPQDEPDLIEAIATNGRVGYVRKAELYGEQPRTPAQAVAMTRARTARTVAVYAADGTTIIGRFIIGDGHADAGALGEVTAEE